MMSMESLVVAMAAGRSAAVSVRRIARSWSAAVEV
jgi:hypothetical protein